MEPKVKHFESGASTSGELPPYECLTLSFLRRCALRMQLGLHYGKHNWKKGARDKQFILDRLNHAMEHLKKAQEEIDNDKAYDDDDLAAVAVNCMFAMHYQESAVSINQCESPTFKKTRNPEFQQGLRTLLNYYSVDAQVGATDTELVAMITDYIERRKA